jgi:hypothetical protein
MDFIENLDNVCYSNYEFGIMSLSIKKRFWSEMPTEFCSEAVDFWLAGEL